MGTGVVEVVRAARPRPFGAKSLAELRREATAERAAAAELLAMRELPAPDFDEVMSGEGAWFKEQARRDAEVRAGWGEGWEYDADEAGQPRPRRHWAATVLLVLVLALGILALGVGMLLALFWVSSAIAAPPEWLPEELWLGSWAERRAS